MEIDFLTCPKCRSKNWADIPNTEDKNRSRYRCVRCGHCIVLGSCSKCKTEKAWAQIVGIEEKGAHRPMYRYRCSGCGRVVGILLG